MLKTVYVITRTATMTTEKGRCLDKTTIVCGVNRTMEEAKQNIKNQIDFYERWPCGTVTKKAYNVLELSEVRRKRTITHRFEFDISIQSF